MRQCTRRNADAVVADAQPDVRLGRVRIGRARHIAPGETRHVNPDPAAGGQRIAGVQHEIENRLLDLRRIDFDQRRLVRHLARQLDVFANQARQHALQPENGLIEIDLLREKHLLAAERQQLLRQRRRALPRLLDFLEGRSIRIVRRPVIEQQLRVAENRRQQIIEIVRDAARQPPDALHLLEVRQPRLEHPPFGGVALDAHQRVLRTGIRAGSSSI